MNTNAKKEKAIELLKQMDIYAPYIKGFREKGMVCFFERFGGYWADQEPELYDDFGECYSFLIVTAYPEEWATLMHTEGNRHTAFAYVWNKDDDWCSEFGSVTVQSFGGGIRRIA